jgi:hypothetical protein
MKAGRSPGARSTQLAPRVLNWYNIFARTDDDEMRVGYFLVRAETPEVRLRLLEIRLLPALIRSSAICVTFCAPVCTHCKAIPH